MRIAVPIKNDQIYQHFGMAAQFKVYTVENDQIVSTEIIQSQGRGHGMMLSLLAENGIGFPVMPNIWRAVMAGWTIEDGKVTDVTLYPIDLGMKASRSQRGLPRLSGDKDTLCYLQSLSAPFGTTIEIKDGVGTIRL